MAQQVIKPYVTVTDSNGNPYVAAKLYVYLVTTTTLASIYTNEALSIAASNPATSDAAGNFPRLYIGAGTYKLRAETSAGVLIWQEDNIDTGLQAATGALPISRGGTGATTAAAAVAALGAASASSVTDLASDITAIQTTLQGITPTPGGRLTLTTATPVLVADVAAGTAVYYTPYINNVIPIWDGSQFNATVFAELTLTLNANHLASSIYDCFVINDSNTIRLVTGPAWNTATAAAGARGTGAGTTELTRTHGGLWTNTVSMTARNGATTYSVNASAGTYVGSIAMDGTNGQLTCHVGYGQSRKFGVWNAYNRRRIYLKAGDSTASWNYTTATIRQSNAAAGNTLAIFSGLPEEFYDLQFHQGVIGNSANGNATVGIGFNSTTAYTGYFGRAFMVSASASVFHNLIAKYTAIPSIGINNINCLENAPAAGSETFAGTEASCLLTAHWQG